MKKILFLLAVALTALQMSAADVTPSQAQAAANAFLTKQVATGRLKASAASNLKLVKAEASVAKPTAVDYYIFNSAKSYVVIAGDDLAPQILMYGEEGALDLDNIPPGMQWMLNKFKYQIDGLKAGTMVPVKLPKYATTPVAPLVNANWDQSAPYYNQCPTSGSRHAVTGCPATSLSMCYYKWKWPETYPACAALSGTGGLSAAALSERAADWDNIIDEYTGPSNTSYTTAQANAVAWLMRYAGQSIPDYMYSTSASGANDPEIYQGVLNMGYTDAQLLTLTELVQSGWSYGNSSQNYTDAQWNEWMLNELQNGRPIEYLAYDITSGQVSGHAFNVFGVNSSGQYYVNWGWSGDSNGYCTLHNFTTSTGATGQSGSYVFKYGEAMIIGIEPPAGATTTPKITVNPTTLNMSTTVGTPVTATFTVTGANLTDRVNLSLSGANAFSLSTSTISATMAANGVNVTVTYNPTAAGSNEATVTLTSTDAETVTVKLNGTAEPAPLETYPPVMLEATNITTTSFTATWTDATPAANVESYTLYVQDESHPIKPEVALLDTTDWTANTNIPTGWTQYNLKYYSSTSSCYLSTDGYVQSSTYDLTGYDKVTVRVYSQPYNGDNTITVATSVDSKTVTVPSGSSYTWYTFILNCASSDYVKLTSSGMPDLRYMKVYAGDLTATQLKFTETGDATYRVITGITNKSYTVTGLTEGGTFNFYVVANYVNGAIGTSNTKQVTLLENTNPVVTVNPAALDMTANVGETATATFNVAGSYLTGDVTLALTDANGVYSITPTTISAANAANGVDVTVTYAPTAFGAHSATITLSSADAENVTVTLNGTATLAKFTPVMLPAIEDYINLTEFRADWTDATLAENVASYTLEVAAKSTEPEPVDGGVADFTDIDAVVNDNNQLPNVAESASQYLPDGWTAENYLYINDGFIISGASSSWWSSTYGALVSPVLDLTGYNKVTVVARVKSYYPSNYGQATIRILTGAAYQDFTLGNSDDDDYQTVTAVLNCSESDQVKVQARSNYFALEDVRIYAGDITEANMLMAMETGDEAYRLVTGITDKFYTVENLTAEGTFLYKVKAHYVDGTESDWSNIEEVTLFQNGHGYQVGDVDHNGIIDISDIAALNDYLLTNDASLACTICSDVDQNGIIDISDIAALIDWVLTGNAPATRMVAKPLYLLEL